VTELRRHSRTKSESTSTIPSIALLL